MKRLAVIAATVIAVIGVASTASAQTEGCATVDYQGAPTEICPPAVPDPTNCYTGNYQGAPIEICLPTGEKLPEGSEINDAPVAYHVSNDYVTPTPAAVSTQPAPLAPDEVEVDLSWVYDFVAILGW